MAARRNFYSSKFSEYRQNYLPFDYYDFMITAKENENLRFKNKLRDYLHTPFDWDEDLEVHREQQQAALERSNQATQTSDRPNRHDQLKKLTQAGNPIEEVSNAKPAFNPKRAKTPPPKSKPTKSASVQVSMHEPAKKPARRATRSAQQNRSSKKTHLNVKNNNTYNNNYHNNDRNIRRSSEPDREELLKSYKLAKSMTNIAIQTPFEWKLRDYSKREPSRSASTSIHRSASVASLQPRRPPFANYGWATQTKDLSKKPTRNALANKVLARKYHDENAVCELKLQALKKEATAMANEQCALESKSLDRFHSDSREWLSEYENKYPDHTKSAHKHDYYHSVNPNKLKKSSLSDNYQSLRVPKSSASHKIYY